MATGTILDTILEYKREELELQKKKVPFKDLEIMAQSAPTPLNFSGALLGDPVRLIAEIKQASPSKGILTNDFDAVSLAKLYAENGAAALSVLTEVKYFKGSLEHLWTVKQNMLPYSLPVLRKDFIFDPYQIYESLVHGADSILLIVSMLEKPLIKELLEIAKSLWLQPLVEVHNEEEMGTALDISAEIIGINHRDLKTFTIDMTLSERLKPMVPRGKILVAESGIKSSADVAHLKRIGMHAVLVGETLVTSNDVASKVRELTSAR
jgi:indole-3-glycerol phosphate synthase